MVPLPFANRLEAGRLLADQLAFHKVPVDAIVLGLPRGGVPVAFAITERLHLPLDVMVVRKLGVPWQPEVAMGAIAGSVRVLNEKLIQELGVSIEEIDRIASREQSEIKRREQLYRGGRSSLDLDGRSVVLIDDGLAMGSTMTAAARYVQTRKPSRLTIAVPVGSRAACARLLMEADDLVCLATPEPFVAVSRWYRDFGEVGDAQVQNLLVENRHQLRQFMKTRNTFDSVCIS
jgi:putative phosphoribosyl transferase